MAVMSNDRRCLYKLQNGVTFISLNVKNQKYTFCKQSQLATFTHFHENDVINVTELQIQSD